MNRIVKKCLFIFLLQALSFGVIAQSSTTDRQAIKLLERAKKEMASSKFEEANKTFREMLALKTTLPTEMCYFFATTLYKVGQYENSQNFLDKYLNLAGKSGEFYNESIELQTLLKEQFDIIQNCSLCDSKGYVKEICSFCEGNKTFKQACSTCYGRKTSRCTVCFGEGVVIETNKFKQRTYKTCSKCEGKGFAACSSCSGEGFVTDNCQVCGGSGHTSTAQICKHSHQHTP